MATSCDMWVLPPPAQSKWFARIDWYLNWQLCKGLAHERRRPSVELFRIMEEGGIAYTDTPVTANAPLMVISHGRVPASQCVVIENAKTLKDWLASARTLMSAMHTRKARIFLPEGASVVQASEIWRSLAVSDIEIEFSTDEDTL
jgi:hypothetical protein